MTPLELYDKLTVLVNRVKAAEQWYDSEHDIEAITRANVLFEQLLIEIVKTTSQLKEMGIEPIWKELY